MGFLIGNNWFAAGLIHSCMLGPPRIYGEPRIKDQYHAACPYHSQPIRGQYPGHMITLSQSEASIQVT